MGYLDNLVSSDFSAGLVNAVESFIQKQGGAQGLVRKFETSGLGQVAQSWVGQGQNHPISAAQVHRALGFDTLQELGAKVGISADEMADKLSRLLPKALDKLTAKNSAGSRGGYPWTGKRKNP